MADPFQTQSKQQTAATSKPVLRDMAEDKLLKPRPRKMVRAIKMLDVLTAGDEKLYEYLKTQQAEAAKRVEQAKEDMELAETPEEAAEFAPDPMDELMAQDVPAVNTFDFEAFKNSLLQTCQSQLTGMVTSAVDIPPIVLYARCHYITPDGVCCSAHSVDIAGFEVLEHYPEDRFTPLISEIYHNVLQTSENIEYVEVYSDHLCAVYNDGYVKKFPRNTV